MDAVNKLIKQVTKEQEDKNQPSDNAENVDEDVIFLYEKLGDNNQQNETTEEQQHNKITQVDPDVVIVAEDEIINFEYDNDNIEYGEDVIFIYEKRRIL